MQGFAVSSRDDLPETLFRGYCFVGADYIFGEEGQRQFQAERGLTIEAGEDGCYTTVRRDGGDLIFGADSSGHMKIWYYWDNGFWVVATSVALAAQLLRAHGVNPEPNYGQLARIRVGGLIFNQQASLHSIVKGLFLVPLDCELVVNASGCSVRPHPRHRSSSDYRDCLSEFCEIWLSRFAGLLSNPKVQIWTDLSGGLDSRATTAVVARASSMSASRASAPIAISSPTKSFKVTDRDDYVVAKEVAEALGLRIADRRPARESPTKAFRSWYEINLGVYDLLSPLPYHPDPLNISVGGGGGENNRTYLEKHLGIETFGELLRLVRRKKMVNGAELKSEMAEAVKIVRKLNPTDVGSLVLFYREFRARFHGGRAPQTQVRFSPLSSRYMAACAETAGRQRLKTSQVHYDLFLSLEPRLLDIPFELQHKSPTPEVRAALTAARKPERLTPGAVFCGPYIEAPATTAKQGSFFPLFREAYQMAKASRFASDFLGPDLMRKAERHMALAQKAGDRPPSNDAKTTKAATAVLTCALFDMPDLTDAILGERLTVS